MAHLHELMGDLRVAGGTGELADGLALPVEAEPGQPVDERRDGSFGGPFAVGVLDAQQHLAALVLGIGPAEQRGPGPADMQVAGGDGAKRVTTWDMKNRIFGGLRGRV